VDIFVERRILIEVKAIDALRPIDLAQMMTYLRLAGCRLGLILNFNVKCMKAGNSTSRLGSTAARRRVSETVSLSSVSPVFNNSTVSVCQTASDADVNVNSRTRAAGHTTDS
jgi:hypothetical protein